MKAITILLLAVGPLTAGNATAQLLRGLPQAGAALRPLGNVLGPVSDTIGRSVAALAQARLDRIAASIRAHPDRIARDPNGFAARRGEVIVTDPDDMLIAAAKARDLRLLDRGDTLGIAYARFALPDGISLKAGIALLRRLGASDASADQLYTQSGTSRPSAPPVSGHGVRIGMIDGGVAGTTATQRGFATGAPRASEHGTAIASLIVGSSRIKGAAPGAQLFAADIYGDDQAGGSASAIVQALGWLVGEHVPVVTISLVGPPNPLLARVVAAAQTRGTIIVAAVGNDGPVSPPNYPASYAGVIAVTGIDGRKRLLIEAGHATHLDYAAPGADMVAASPKGNDIPVRGTSFAAPLVAATIALAYPVADPSRRATAIASVDNAAERRDKRYGRGIVCGRCATAAK
ncbi:MAG: S8 family serine peptidase [Pseudomonadota bacterium]|nr:S8 family serine peptidase [Pseudomonadota bacterium]